MTWLNVMEYLCHKWPRICSTCRKHFPVLSSFTTSSLFVLLFLFFFAIVLSVLLRYADSDYPFGIFKLFLSSTLNHVILKGRIGIILVPVLHKLSTLGKDECRSLNLHLYHKKINCVCLLLETTEYFHFLCPRYDISRQFYINSTQSYTTNKIHITNWSNELKSN